MRVRACERRARPPSIVARPRVLPVLVRLSSSLSLSQCSAVRVPSLAAGCVPPSFNATARVQIITRYDNNRAPTAVVVPAAAPFDRPLRRENGGQRRAGSPHHRERRQYLRGGTYIICRINTGERLGSGRSIDPARQRA